MRAPRRRRALLAAGAIGALFIGAVSAGTAMPRREIERGAAGLAQSFANLGDHKRAAETLFAAYRANPTEGGRIEVARALLIAGENASAIDLLGAPSESAAEEFARRHLLAEALLRVKRHADAQTLARSLILESPGDARARLILARAAYQLGNFESAKAMLGDALRAGGEALADAWLFRARMALQDNAFETAASAVERARAAGAQQSEARALDAEVSIRSGAVIEPAFAGFSGPQRDYLSVLVDMREGRFEEAARRLRDIEPWVVALPYGDLFVARVRTLAGDDAQGAIGLDHALLDAPGNPLMLAAKLEQLLESGRLSEAARTASKSEADSAAALARLVAARRLMQWDAAVIHAEQLADLTGSMPVDAFLFGAASAPARRAVERAQSDLAFADAVSAGLRGSPRRAGEAAAYLSRPGADPAELVWAGRFLLASNDDAAASDAFERALAAAPNCKECLTGALRPVIRTGDYADVEARIRGEARGGDRALLIARALAAQGRFPDAAALIAADQGASIDRSDALFAASLFAVTEQADVLAEFAGAFVRRHPDSAEAAHVLALARLDEEAAGAARRALLAAPANHERAADYASAMVRLGRQAEAAAFLNYLQRRAGVTPALVNAAAILGGEPAQAADDRPQGLASARADYLREPSDPRLIARYAAALGASGDIAAEARVRREACFWARSAGCQS